MGRFNSKADTAGERLKWLERAQQKSSEAWQRVDNKKYGKDLLGDTKSLTEI